MRDSQKRQLVELIRRVAKDEIAEALNQHLEDHEHKEKVKVE
jgi:hypothetical protein